MVYRAVDTRLGRRVALKILPQKFTRDPDRLSRFRQEARTASGLSDNDRAAIWLERWVTPNPEYARVTLDLPPHPAFAAFRADSRYLNARRRLGLPN